MITLDDIHDYTLRIDLVSVMAERCRQLAGAAWRHRAPKRLAAAYDDGR